MALIPASAMTLLWLCDEGMRIAETLTWGLDSVLLVKQLWNYLCSDFISVWFKIFFIRFVFFGCGFLQSKSFLIERLPWWSSSLDSTLPGSIPSQGTRSHTPKLRVPMSQLKIPCAAMKIEDPMCCN